jgi:DNA polymerase-3 subunit alpha
MNHLVLLAKNETGYKNLCCIVSNANMDGTYYGKPRTDMDDLRRHSDGLIALSACIAGKVPEMLLAGDYDGAKEQSLAYLDIFGEGNFYLEIQDQGLEEERRIRDDLIRLSKETGIPLAATNDIHYLNREDADTHNVLLCVQTNSLASDQNRMRFSGDRFYMRTEEEMRALFSDIPEAVDNTLRIAEMCDFRFDLKSVSDDGGGKGDFFPRFQHEGKEPNAELLRAVCESGLAFRYGEQKEQHRERLDFELAVIEQMGFTDYFLIVWDFIRFARENGIAVGPGRGSAAGSIVSYVLRITDVDPIRYGLLFERFLNPERKSMPDIDIDFCIERRGEVIDYVREKYGQENVAQIITFSTLQARQVIKDLGRVLGVPFGDVDRFVKTLPAKAKNLAEAYGGKSLDAEGNVEAEFLEESGRFRRAIEEGKYEKLMEYACALEGKPRQPGTHAAGVVISGVRLADSIPLYKAKDGSMCVQYTMNTVEDLRFLKMDFLGLRNLTLIDHTVRMIKQNRGIEVDLPALAFDDPKVYALIGSGQTEGIFQLESGGMQGFMRQFKPKRFEEIVVGISMYRPGPMDAIPEYLRNRNNPQSIHYLHPKLEPILADTFGVMVYQEQVMQIVRDLAGFSYGESDEVRRNMSKKKGDKMLKAKDAFVAGCLKNGIPVDVAGRIGDQMIAFAKYAFNKSHAAVYAVLAYQTAYLKAHYREEFMAALMSSVMGTQDKMTRYIRSARDMGIRVLPPDVNKAHKAFSVSNGAIVMGLGAVKNVGSAAIDAITSARRNGSFADMAGFVSSVDSKAVNKRAVESLIFAGAFDSICGNRARMMQEYTLLSDVFGKRKYAADGQTTLFDSIPEINTIPVSSAEAVADYPADERMEKEKEMLGLYFTAHPLDRVKWVMERVGVTDTYRIKHPEEYDDVVYGSSEKKQILLIGMVSDVRIITIKQGRNAGKPMAIVTLEDYMGSIEVVVFSSAYPASEKALTSEIEDYRIVVVRGTVHRDPDRAFPAVHASKVTPVEVVEDFFRNQDAT